MLFSTELLVEKHVNVFSAELLVEKHATHSGDLPRDDTGYDVLVCLIAEAEDVAFDRRDLFFSQFLDEAPVFQITRVRNHEYMHRLFWRLSLLQHPEVTFLHPETGAVGGRPARIQIQAYNPGFFCKRHQEEITQPNRVDRVPLYLRSLYLRWGRDLLILMSVFPLRLRLVVAVSVVSHFHEKSCKKRRVKLLTWHPNLNVIFVQLSYIYFLPTVSYMRFETTMEPINEEVIPQDRPQTPQPKYVHIDHYKGIQMRMRIEVDPNVSLTELRRNYQLEFEEMAYSRVTLNVLVRLEKLNVILEFPLYEEEDESFVMAMRAVSQLVFDKIQIVKKAFENNA